MSDELADLKEEVEAVRDACDWLEDAAISATRFARDAVAALAPQLRKAKVEARWERLDRDYEQAQKDAQRTAQYLHEAEQRIAELEAALLAAVNRRCLDDVVECRSCAGMGRFNDSVGCAACNGKGGTTVTCGECLKALALLNGEGKG